MEYKRIWLPLGIEIIGSAVLPTDDARTKKADEEISKHLNLGWRIVSTAPLAGSNFAGGNNTSYTTGIEVFMVKE
jgi:hypothetical protein